MNMDREIEDLGWSRGFGGCVIVPSTGREIRWLGDHWEAQHHNDDQWKSFLTLREAAMYASRAVVVATFDPKARVYRTPDGWWMGEDIPYRWRVASGEPVDFNDVTLDAIRLVGGFFDGEVFSCV